MREVITMTFKAQKRAKILEMVKNKKIKQKDAAIILGICRRQLIRIFKEYLSKGDEALNHKLIGKPGNHRISSDIKEKIMQIVRNNYKGFKPTFIAEKLYEEHHIKIGASTLRLWMMETGLWKKIRKTAKHRTRRPRKEHFGEMIQMDGSIHDWFGTGKEVCLMNMVDDATGTSYGLFDTGETTQVALQCLFDWIMKYGIPYSIYCDYKSLFYTKREATIEEQLAGKLPLTKFGEVCHRLGIEMIYAHSPQAKGAQRDGMGSIRTG
ncbi:helix-turn-helix domain-containing protein [Thermospira aquatica]|uniref:Helix-turn-helix domain-containing protein n=1 Tax=Thermospira aquatica TaxID=2828656 RepID=A0AAX3BEW0_9SPIR|nr:helix-turn-helix domain-containing protein [Thermospira aquatica]URA10888.1 helix-turn-helix domain-containing protein [Thermospira aquatica]